MGHFGSNNNRIPGSRDDPPRRNQPRAAFRSRGPEQQLGQSLIDMCLPWMELISAGRRFALRCSGVIVSPMLQAKPCLICSVSGDLILVMSMPPWSGLVPSFRGAVQPRIHSPERFDAPSIRGVGVIQDAILKCKRTHTRSITLVRRLIGATHRSEIDLNERPAAFLIWSPLKCFFFCHLLRIQLQTSNGDPQLPWTRCTADD